MSYSYSWKNLFCPGNAVDFFNGEMHCNFETENQRFSLANAWWLSELSRLIYVKGSAEHDSESQTSVRNSYLHEVGLEERWFYNGRYVQCSLVGPLVGGGRMFSALVFRGTSLGIYNWIYNLDCLLSAWPQGGRVHRGFKILLLEAWDEIEQMLNSLTGSIYYTGHSLGGALAVLAATLRKPEAVYTFGAPRMANRSFLEATQHINIYRVVNPQDIVACVPPFPGVMNVGEAHYLTGSRAADQSRNWFEAPTFLADHSPSNYSLARPQ